MYQGHRVPGAGIYDSVPSNNTMGVSTAFRLACSARFSIWRAVGVYNAAKKINFRTYGEK